MQTIVSTGRLQEGKYFVGSTEVAVFYFRSMYDPHHFKGAEHWSVRQDIERSRAVKVRGLIGCVVNYSSPVVTALLISFWHFS